MAACRKMGLCSNASVTGRHWRVRRERPAAFRWCGRSATRARAWIYSERKVNGDLLVHGKIRWFLELSPEQMSFCLLALLTCAMIVPN
jgi:hypothetical protein